MADPKIPTGSWHRRVTLHDLVAMLTPHLGPDKSAEAVDSAAALLGFRGPVLEQPQADALLDHLSKVPGKVGIAARQAQRQSSKTETKTEEQPPSSSALTRGRDKARAELVSLLSGALGAEKAEEVISTAVRKLGLNRFLDPSHASAILEELASMPGAVGATARFAKARLLLKKKT